MTRFIAGLVLGGVMVGACWFSNRLAYYDLRQDMLEVYKLASELRAMQPEPRPKREERRPDEVWTDNGRDDDVTYAARDAQEDEGELAASEPCVLASFPPKPCSEFGEDKAATKPKSAPYRLGAQRKKSRRYDPDGPWVDLPTPEISPTDRAELVKKLEARGGKNPLAGG